MGGVNSYCLPRHQNPNLCRENHSTPKVKGHRRNLSAAFNLADMDSEVMIEQMNVNTATEEELMTLPGINRQTAKNIVEYRRQIGGFKKVEDLALVSGVGATKLSIIRPEICVGRKKTSQSSSRSSSLRDLSMQDSASRSSAKSRTNFVGCFPKVNINTSNVFQLMKVKGVSQQLAENVVAYRDKKGHFRSIDELVKVKGINNAVLSAIRPHLMLNDDTPPTSVSEFTPNVQPLTHSRNHSYTNGMLYIGSAPVFIPPVGSQDDLLNIYGPISRKSTRRKKSPIHLRKDNRPVMRLASWNLQKFTTEKGDNPGVKEVVCMSILENGWSIIAVQDLYEQDALQKICDELNNPTIPNVKKWPGLAGRWNYVTSTSQSAASTPATSTSQSAASTPATMPLLGYVYNSASVQLLKKVDLPLPPNNQSPYPLITVFKNGNWESVLVNIQVIGATVTQATITSLVKAIKLKTKDWSLERIVILGDFGEAVNSPEFQGLAESQDFHCVASSDSSPIEGCSVQMKNSDQIWTCESLEVKSLTGEGGQIREGLCSPWIPDGWRWGGPASDHVPVWMEVFTDPSQDEPETRHTPSQNSLQMLRMAMPLVGMSD